MTKDTALRLALEALENITSVSICEATHHAKKDRHLLCEDCPNEVRHLKAITAIKAALEAKDEPVAYINVEQRKLDWAKYVSWDTPTVVNLPKIPLYTTPPQRTWVGLTNDEVNNFAAGCHLGNSVQGAIYKAEAKLKEKNT